MNTILIIEDYEEIRTSLRDILTIEGYKVLEASDGAKGLAICRDNPVDVIVTDILMPNKEGIETIFELRRDYPNIKIIAISGGGCISSKDCLAMAKRVGASHAFQKPLKINEIINAVQQLCQENHCH